MALAAFFEEQAGIGNLLYAISAAASWDEQLSEGQSLSEREESVLQALDLMTHKNDTPVWIRATTLREQIGRLLSQSIDQMGHTQWIAHMLKRLHLLDESKRKRDTDGMVYAINPIDMRNMMRRYNVAHVTSDA